jgi:hypothetical protein
MMKLMFVASEDAIGCGDNADLFVIAETRDQAIDVWRKHYELEGTLPDRVFEVPAALKCFEATPRVVQWHSEVKEL